MLLKLSFLQGDTEHLQHCMSLLANRDSSDFTSKIMPDELNYPQRTLTMCCGYQQLFSLVFLRAVRGKVLIFISSKYREAQKPWAKCWLFKTGRIFKIPAVPIIINNAWCMYPFCVSCNLLGGSQFAVITQKINRYIYKFRNILETWLFILHELIYMPIVFTAWKFLALKFSYGL